MSEENEMPQQRPNVFPNKNMMEEANKTGEEIAQQFAEENNLKPETSDAEQKAAEEMARKTQEQIAERNRLMQEQIDKARKLDEQRAEMMSQQPPNQGPPNQQPPTPPTPPTPPSGDSPSGGNQQNQPQEVDKLKAISEPQYDAAFDVIPLPSEGKIYKTKKKSIKVAYLTAADENILSNPNLMESGEFLEVLLNRKILEPELRYENLHVGDRNAIMIWLRATAYGHEYPIQVYDPTTYEPFEHIVDLSTIKSKPLGAEPDKEGLFDFTLPVTKTPIKYKLLTVGEVDEIEEHIEKIKETLGAEHADTVTYTLAKQIVEVNGNRDREFIGSFVQTMRAGDSRALRKNIDDIESGVDMKLEIETPGGESINPFLPFNLDFFWPQL
jgi:hypothetical protein